MAAGRHKAIIEIDAKVSQADKKIKKLEGQVGKLERKLAKTSKTSGEAEASMKKLGAAATAWISVEGIRKLDDLVSRSIKYQNIMANLPFSIDAARASTKGLITDFDLSRSAVAAHALGITKNAEEYAKFSEAAVKLGSKLGIDTPQAMEQLTAAVGRGSAKILDNFGIMAKGFESMSMEERLNLISEAANDTALVVDENAQAWARLKNELEVAADKSMPAVVAVAGFAAEEILGMADAVRDLSIAFDDSGFTMEGYKASLRSVTDLYIDSQKHMLGAAGFLDELVASTALATDANETYHGSTESIISGYLAQVEAGNKVVEMTEKQNEAFRKQFGIVSGAEVGLEEGEDFLQGPMLGATSADFGIKKKRGSGKKRKGPSTTDRTAMSEFGLGDAIAEQAGINSFEARATGLEREIELMRAREEATADIFDAEIALAEMRGETHEAEVLQLDKVRTLREEEKAAAEANAKLQAKLDKEVLQKRKQTSDAVIGMMGTQAQMFDLLAEQEGETGKNMAIAAAVARGFQAMAVGAQVTGEGIASIASQNYVQGVAQIAAGVTNFAIGGALMAKDISAASSAANGGGGAGGGSLGGSSPLRGPGGNTGNSDGSNIPASPNGSAPGGTQNTSGGAGNTYNVTVNQTGKVDEDSAMMIIQAAEEASYTRGRISA